MGALLFCVYRLRHVAYFLPKTQQLTHTHKLQTHAHTQIINVVSSCRLPGCPHIQTHAWVICFCPLECSPPPHTHTVPTGSPQFYPLNPQGTSLLASSGFSCCWAGQPAKVSDIWSSICDVTNSWLVIRPLGWGWGWGVRSYFQQTLSWNSKCFCIKPPRLQNEWV